MNEGNFNEKNEIDGVGGGIVDGHALCVHPG